VSWIVFIAAVALLTIFRGGGPKFLAKVMWAINALLAFIAGGALANIVLGEWLAAAMAAVFGWVGSWLGVAGSIVGGLVLLVVAVLVVLDLLDRKADSAAVTGLIVIPLIIVAAAGGPIASAGSQLYGAAERIGMSSLGQLVGGG
jgi:hypothetical protein